MFKEVQDELGNSLMDDIEIENDQGSTKPARRITAKNGPDDEAEALDDVF